MPIPEQRLLELKRRLDDWVINPADRELLNQLIDGRLSQQTVVGGLLEALKTVQYKFKRDNPYKPTQGECKPTWFDVFDAVNLAIASYESQASTARAHGGRGGIDPALITDLQDLYKRLHEAEAQLSEATNKFSKHALKIGIGSLCRQITGRAYELLKQVAPTTTIQEVSDG